jgi:hypothetical protein
MSKPAATLSPQLAVLLRGALYTDMQRACEDVRSVRPAARRLGCAFCERSGDRELAPKEDP